MRNGHDQAVNSKRCAIEYLLCLRSLGDELDGVAATAVRLPVEEKKQFVQVRSSELHHPCGDNYIYARVLCVFVCILCMDEKRII